MYKVFRAWLCLALLGLVISACGANSSGLTSNLKINSVTLDGNAVDITKVIPITGAQVLNVQTNLPANFGTSATLNNVQLVSPNISFTVRADSTASNWFASFDKGPTQTGQAAVITATGTVFTVLVYDPNYNTIIGTIRLSYTKP